MTVKVVLHNPNQEYRGPDMNGVLTYVGGVWEREVNCRWFHVARTGGRLFSKRWAVFRFEGADTAAIGGGKVWHDRVSDPFDTEYEAIRCMAGITEAQSDDARMEQIVGFLEVGQ